MNAKSLKLTPAQQRLKRKCDRRFARLVRAYAMSQLPLSVVNPIVEILGDMALAGYENCEQTQRGKPNFVGDENYRLYANALKRLESLLAREVKHVAR